MHSDWLVWMVVATFYALRGLAYVWEFLTVSDEEGFVQVPGVTVLISAGILLFWPAIPLFEICAAFFRDR